MNETQDSKQVLPDMPSRRFGSLRWRIFVWVFIVGLGSLLIMAYQGYHCATQAVVASQEKFLRSVALSYRDRVRAWLSEMKADLKLVAASDCARGNCASSTDSGGKNLLDHYCDTLEALREGNPAYENLTIYSPNWDPLIQMAGMRNRNEEKLTADFKSELSKEKGLVVGSFYLHDDGKVGVHVGYTVSDVDDGGYVVAGLGLSLAIDAIFSSTDRVAKTEKVYLLSSDGRYLSAPRDSGSLRGQKCLIPSELISSVSSAILEYKDHRGITVLGTSAMISDLGWTVVAEIDSQEAFAWLRVLKFRAVTTGAVTLIIVLILGLKSAGMLSKPLRELAAVSRKVSAGRREERLGSLDGAEAREVGVAFNTMLDDLAAYHQKLTRTASLAAIGELSSSIVHEMRNPLSSIKLNLQALHRRVADDAAFSELGDIAWSQVLRLENMFSDLLSYGKPIELVLEEGKFGDMIEHVLESVSGTVKEREVSISVEDDLGDLSIVADWEQMLRAVTNLVENAVQASDPGGKVIISAGVVPENPGRAVIAVCDNGPGIPPAHKDMLFQPFFSTREGGTGLGLANVKKIVEYHGGTVSAENRPDGGAAFTILLPLGGPSS